MFPRVTKRDVTIIDSETGKSVTLEASGYLDVHDHGILGLRLTNRGHHFPLEDLTDTQLKQVIDSLLFKGGDSD
jgi:hypothetical protein